MPLVPATVTPLSPLELASALYDGHVQAFGTAPTVHELGMSWAQCALETGQGAHAIRANLGNLTCFADHSPTGDWYQVGTIEYDHATAKLGRAARLCYVAYPSAVDGAVGYWRRLATKYGPALALFDKGDPRAVAVELRNLYYYTASVETYAAAMGSLFHEFMAKYAGHFAPLAATEPPPAPPPTEPEAAAPGPPDLAFDP